MRVFLVQTSVQGFFAFNLKVQDFYGCFLDKKKRFIHILCYVHVVYTKFEWHIYVTLQFCYLEYISFVSI